MDFPGRKPEWLTFDCYGTLIQWDEGLLDAFRKILRKYGARAVEPAAFLRVYDKYEHEFEQRKPHKPFRAVAGEALETAMKEFGILYDASDVEILTSSIAKMPPFPEVVQALAALKAQGFKLCIISNADDGIIAGNVAQMGGHIDKVVTAEQACWYKPSRQIFEHAYQQIGVTKDDIIHICASPNIDHAAARDMGFRCIWIDRGTGRPLLPDYKPDRTFATLDLVPALFDSIGWGNR